MEPPSWTKRAVGNSNWPSGRPPNQAESAMLAELIRGDNAAESVEDVLWAVTMLPEFQLIY